MSSKTTPNSFTLSKPAIFSFQECLWFLDRNYDDCLHHIKDGVLTRAIEATDGPILFSIQEDSVNLRITMLKGKVSEANIQYLQSFVTSYIDLSSPLHDFYGLLEQDFRLAYMSESFYGLRMIGIPDLFEALVWCIIGQQINLTFAYRLKRRLVETFGQSIDYEDRTYHIFPSPGKLANINEEELHSMQFSRRKAQYIIGIARMFEEGTLSKTLLLEVPDLTSRIHLLTTIKGVGMWTANYVLMKCLLEKDCIPYGDVGLLSAFRSHGIGQGDVLTKEKTDQFFASFSGWQSYMVFYLWRSLAVPA